MNIFTQNNTGQKKLKKVFYIHKLTFPSSSGQIVSLDKICSVDIVSFSPALHIDFI